MSTYETARPPSWVQAQKVAFETRNPFPLLDPGQRLTTTRGDMFRRRTGNSQVLMMDTGQGIDRPLLVGEAEQAPAPSHVDHETQVSTGRQETNPDTRGVATEAQYAGSTLAQIQQTGSGEYNLIQGTFVAPLFGLE